MRVFFRGLAASAAFTLIGHVAAATTPLVFTLDLNAPCSGGTCTGTHPTDVGLQLQANSFSYGPGTGSQLGKFVAQLGVLAPVVCDEIQSGGAFGPTTQSRLEHDFTNASPGGLLEFNNLGRGSVVDLGALSYDGSSPPGVAASYSNYNAPQVLCYQINPVTGGNPVYAAGPGGIFYSGFENSHATGEPWVSTQTVRSPQPNVGNYLGYVVQIHNANAAIGWHVDFGFDTTFFDVANNGGFPPTWSLLSPATTQPGPVGVPSNPQQFSAIYTVATGDIQTSTNSVYLYVSHAGSVAAVSNWAALGTSFYPATASIFPPFGTYPQRFDDKSAVASSSNLPAQNIGSIVCNNDTTSTQCTWYDADGNSGAPVVFANTVSPTGTVSADPLVYFADPTSGSSAPGTLTADVLAPSAVSCNDPNSILASAITAASFTQSPSAKGGQALAFGFAAGSGTPYVPGTATCSATFTNSGYSPNLSSTVSFSITMLQTQATHFQVSAPSSATAGNAFTFTVSALDAGNNVVPSYAGTVKFTSSDGSIQKSLPANSTLTNGTGTFSATLVTAGSQTISATDTVTSAITGTSSGISIAPAAASTFTVNALSPQTHGVAFQISVTAKDAYDNPATGYAGTVHFTSTDSGAMLPADTTLSNGIISPLPNVTLNTTGPQTVTVTDTTTSSITGTSNSITVN